MQGGSGFLMGIFIFRPTVFSRRVQVNFQFHKPELSLQQTWRWNIVRLFLLLRFSNSKLVKNLLVKWLTSLGKLCHSV